MPKLIQVEDDIPQADRDAYWNLVRLCLCLFNADAGILDEYLGVHKLAPPEERAFVYHECPYYMATQLADLAEEPPRAYYEVYLAAEKLLYPRDEQQVKNISQVV